LHWDVAIVPAAGLLVCLVTACNIGSGTFLRRRLIIQIMLGLRNGALE
jgi:hypothetical protein